MGPLRIENNDEGRELLRIVKSAASRAPEWVKFDKQNTASSSADTKQRPLKSEADSQ